MIMLPAEEPQHNFIPPLLLSPNVAVNASLVYLRWQSRRQTCAPPFSGLFCSSCYAPLTALAALLWRWEPFFLFAGVQAFSPGFNGFTVNLLSVREGLNRLPGGILP